MLKMLSSSTRVTLLLIVLTVCYLAIAQVPVSEQFQSIAQTIVAFFFGTKASEISRQAQPNTPAVG